LSNDYYSVHWNALAWSPESGFDSILSRSPPRTIGKWKQWDRRSRGMIPGLWRLDKTGVLSGVRGDIHILDKG
jgi:hypothetical protein